MRRTIATAGAAALVLAAAACGGAAPHDAAGWLKADGYTAGPAAPQDAAMAFYASSTAYGASGQAEEAIIVWKPLPLTAGVRALVRQAYGGQPGITVTVTGDVMRIRGTQAAFAAADKIVNSGPA